MPKRITKSKREFWKRLTRIESDKPKSRRLSAKWTIELTNVPPNYYEDMEESMTQAIADILAKNIADEIDAEVLRKLHGY
jgi:hypothetical protein